MAFFDNWKPDLGLLAAGAAMMQRDPTTGAPLPLGNAITQGVNAYTNMAELMRKRKLEEDKLKAEQDRARQEELLRMRALSGVTQSFTTPEGMRQGPSISLLGGEAPVAETGQFMSLMQAPGQENLLGQPLPTVTPQVPVGRAMSERRVISPAVLEGMKLQAMAGDYPGLAKTMMEQSQVPMTKEIERVLLAQGIDPRNATINDIQNAASKLGIPDFRNVISQVNEVMLTITDSYQENMLQSAVNTGDPKVVYQAMADIARINQDELNKAMERQRQAEKDAEGKPMEHAAISSFNSKENVIRGFATLRDTISKAIKSGGTPSGIKEWILSGKTTTNLGLGDKDLRLLRKALGDLSLDITKDKTGLTATDKFMERIDEILPNVSDPENVFMERFATMASNWVASAESMRNAYINQGYKPYIWAEDVEEFMKSIADGKRGNGSENNKTAADFKKLFLGGQ